MTRTKSRTTSTHSDLCHFERRARPCGRRLGQRGRHFARADYEIASGFRLFCQCFSGANKLVVYFDHET